MNLGNMNVPLANTDYSLLLSTSIFSEDRRATGISRPEPTTRPAREIVVERPPIRTDAPVFRGIATDDSGAQAVLEIQEPNMDTGTIKYTAVSCKPGETFQWVGNEYKVVAVSLDRGMTLLQPGMDEPVLIAMGHNILDQAMPPLPDVAPYRSGDAQPQNTGYSSGRGRGRTGGRGGVGGTTAATGMPGVTAGMTPITAGSTSLAGLQGALMSSASDPPLPPGSTDDLERRMRARRESQVAAPGGATMIGPTAAPPAAPAAPAASAAELERQLQARRAAQMESTPTTAPAPAAGG